MYTKVDGFTNVSDFARNYVITKGKRKGVVGASRNYIHLLIKKERDDPGSSGIDVLEIHGVYYVRYSINKEGDSR